MRVPPQARRLDGGRLHLQHGPIDLIVGMSGAPEARRAAEEAAVARFAGLLGELCDELPLLRRPARPGGPLCTGPVARRMERAVQPFAAEVFLTPMAAVAGAVAEEVLAALVGAAPLGASSLERAFVNNGGDIALHLAPGESVRIGLVDRPDRPGLFGSACVSANDPVRGVATSGWRGRSFSLGIADAVTILAATAADADAAATLVANAVDLPGHPGIRRVPADALAPDSDLGGRPVTRAVAGLTGAECREALARGARVAERLLGRGLIAAAALHCGGETQVVGMQGAGMQGAGMQVAGMHARLHGRDRAAA